MFTSHLGLSIVGLVAGFIDSIAGGGGLVTLPVLTQLLGPGAHAIGTNKIVGTSGALIAFLVYLKKQKLSGKVAAQFISGIALGSLLGSLVTPILNKEFFRYLLVIICPVVLAMIWKKDAIVKEVKEHPAHLTPFWKRGGFLLFVTGVGVGFYDGFFGPGGGTFMLLGLLWVARLPLFEALLISKLANTASAGTSLISYGVQGYVHFVPGILVAIGMTTGGYLGARLASKRAEKIVKPVLTAVVLVLLVLQLVELCS